MDKKEVIKIKISQNDIFYFSQKYNEEKIHPLLNQAQSLYASVADLPILPSLYSQLEEEIIRRSIHGTAALEGNPLSEARVGEIISATEKVKSDQRAKIEILNLKIVYDFIKKMDNIRGHLPLHEDIIKQVHELISVGIDDDKYRPGSYRLSKVKVGDKDHGGVYVPPKNIKDIKLLMSEFDKCINSQEVMGLDVVIRAAMAHYHLGLIHPFEDGNGRTIRIIEAMLIQSTGVKYFPTMLSNYYYRNMDNYYWAFSLTRKHKEKEITPFLEFVFIGVIESLEIIKEKIIGFIRIATLKDYFSNLRGEKKITHRQYDLMHMLLKLVEPFSMGMLLNNSPFDVLYRGVTERTVRRDVNHLLKMELLSKAEEGKYKLNLRAIG
ncbi:Fic family protein [Candidatus Latescibacterota bacterium]